MTIIHRNNLLSRLTIPFSFILTTLLVTASLVLPNTALAAGSGTLTISPTTGSYSIGNQLVITINENSGSVPINAVEADLTYNQQELQFVSVNTMSSDFNVSPPIKAGGGIVNIPRGTTSGPLTGNKEVASVTFKVVGDAKSSVISIAPTSMMLSSNGSTNVWNGDTTVGSYALSGTVTGAPLNTVATTQAPSGYPVAISVVDKNNLPLVGAKVVLSNGLTAKTDSEGIAGFPSVSSGKYTAQITYSNAKLSEPITVNNSASLAGQKFSYTLTDVNSNGSYPSYLAVIFIVILGGVIIWIISRKRKSAKSKPTSNDRTQNSNTGA